MGAIENRRINEKAKKNVENESGEQRKIWNEKKIIMKSDESGEEMKSASGSGGWKRGGVTIGVMAWKLWNV